MDITNDKAMPLTKQLMNDYEATHASTIAVMQVPHEEVSSYGVIAPQGEGLNGLYSVEKFVEKPSPEEAPSDLAIQKFLKSWKIKLLVLEMKSN